ncbi:hypothetical protein GGI35DRAFT_491099 [Trichoderma velutinum]
MDDFVRHSGPDSDFYYWDQEPSSTIVSQEQTLDPIFNFIEDPSTTVMVQEQPLDPIIQFNEDPSSTVMSQNGPLASVFHSYGDLSSTIVSQEQPEAPVFNFTEDPSSTVMATVFNSDEEPGSIVTSQGSFTPYYGFSIDDTAEMDASFVPYMGGHTVTNPFLFQQVNGHTGVHLGQDAMPVPMPVPMPSPMVTLMGAPMPGPMPGPMPAPNTFQQRNAFLTPPLEQDDTSTSLIPPAQTTNQALRQTPPATPPPRRRRNNPGPRGYRRSAQACTRCRTNKLKCDDNPQGCSNCAATGNTCMAATVSGGEMPRMHAHNYDSLLQAYRRHITSLEARIQAQGGHVPNRPADVGHW